MMIYPTLKAHQIFSALVDAGLLQKLKILFYPSNDYPGYSYIKIFNQYATRSNMIEMFKRQLGIEKTVTFGTIPGKYDYVVQEGNTNQVVHTLKKIFG